MASFSIDLAKYAQARKLGIDEVVREIVTTVGTLVDERSPVGQPEIWAINVYRKSRGLPLTPVGYIGGHFRANNQYKFGSPQDTVVEGEDPSGMMAMAMIKSKVAASPAAGVHYIGNALPYANALENGHSTQAPHGVYGLAAIDMVTAAKRIIAKAVK